MSVFQVLIIFLLGSLAGATLTVLYDIAIRRRVEDEINALDPIVKKFRELPPMSHEDLIYQLTLDEREAARRKDQALADAIRNPQSTGA